MVALGWHRRVLTPCPCRTVRGCGVLREIQLGLGKGGLGGTHPVVATTSVKQDPAQMRAAPSVLGAGGDLGEGVFPPLA